MVKGLFATGFKKRREYVKHPIDLCARLRPETMERECTIKKHVHINYITWTHGSRKRRSKEGTATKGRGNKSFEYNARVSQKNLTGGLCLCQM